MRQLSVQDSVQLMPQPSASLSQQGSMEASWSAAGLPDGTNGGGHRRKGSQESVDMPVSLASGSWHSSLTAAGDPLKRDCIKVSPPAACMCIYSTE